LLIASMAHQARKKCHDFLMRNIQKAVHHYVTRSIQKARGHIEKSATLVVVKNLPLDGANSPCQFQSNLSKHLKVIERKQTSSWQPY
jgi:hypothetical protein